MKTNELRIGNFVKDNIFIYKVASVDFHSIYGEIDNVFNYKDAAVEDTYKSGYYNLQIENIEPVLLTEEWLLKFDWFSIDEGRYTFRDIEYYTISNEGSLYFMGNYTCTDIKYVHQLQNLYFAMTDNELTIK